MGCSREEQMTLTQDYLKKIFDYKDGNLIRKIKSSNRTKIGDIAGSNNGNGYLRVSVLGKYFYAHRIIFMWHFGHFPNEIDHIDGNRKNNKINNLRKATHAQNGKNLTLRHSNKIGISGVRFDDDRKKWHSSISVEKKKIHLGRFDNIDQAIAARKKAEIEFFGQWGRNFAKGG